MRHPFPWNEFPGYRHVDAVWRGGATLIQHPLAIYYDRLAGSIRIQHIRANVSAVWPDNRPYFAVYPDLPEKIIILQLTKYPVKFTYYSIHVNNRCQPVFKG